MTFPSRYRLPFVARFLALALLVLAPFGISAASPALSVTPGRYALTIETLMPHLEVNLRYATTHARRCLSKEKVVSLFPVMTQETFVECDFTRDSVRQDQFGYALVCRNAEAATGSARFRVGESKFYGVLEVKMGGKNMKFSQIVSGLRVGSCSPDG